MRYHHKFSKQAGDTIVEVVIAVAVVSSVLVGAFSLSSSSVRAIRDSEEHSEALQLLQGQVELIRAAAGTQGTLFAFPLTKFCLGPALNHYPDTDPHCLANSRYKLSITGPAAPPAASTSTFNLQATWPALTGGYDTVYLSYRVQVT